MPVNLERSKLQLTSNFEITGLSGLVSKKTRSRLQIDFSGSWAIELDFPRAQSPDSHLMVRVGPTAPLESRYGHLDLITVTLSLETLNAVPHKTHSFELSANSWSDNDRWVRLSTLSSLWKDNPDIQRDDGFRIVVNITSVPPPARPVVAAPLILNNILQLIEGHDVIDTKFFVFSKRLFTDGHVGATDPLPIYASSLLIKNQCLYFENLLNNSFSESKLVDLDRPPVTEYIDKYDYESDSDLGYVSGEEDDEQEELEEGTTTAGHDMELLFDKYNEFGIRSPTDSLSDDSEHGKNANNDSDAESTGSELRLDELCIGQHARYRNRFGKVVPLPDVAFVTWKALIFYLYTSQISFAPLTSRKVPRSRSCSERSQGLPSPPSAKSIYRIADKLGLNDLTELALDHIRSQLSKDVIIHELFSRFTSRYSIIRDMELAFVFEHWDELKSSPEVREMFRKVASGALPHAADVLTSLVFH